MAAFNGFDGFETLLTRKHLKHCKVKHYEPFGKVAVYVKRDENMGRCYFLDTGFVTPCMPKLEYAFSFEVVDEELKLTGLNPKIERYDEAYVFEKRDGFNCLFYEYEGKVIPKTRLAPVARGAVAKVVDLPEFPTREVERMVRDGYVPVFEVWGPKLDELGIVHGCVNVRAVVERENLPSLNVDLIAVMDADYEECNYEFLHPSKVIELAVDYGLNPVKFYGKVRVSYENVTSLMRFCELKNEEEVVTEGCVLHCYEDGLRMFKVKPYDVAWRDVVASKTIPRKRIEYEVQKILLEEDVLEVARNPWEYLEEVIRYLEEDYSVGKKLRKKVKDVFVEVVAREAYEKLKATGEDAVGNPWKYVHGALVGTIKRVASGQL